MQVVSVAEESGGSRRLAISELRRRLAWWCRGPPREELVEVHGVVAAMPSRGAVRPDVPDLLRVQQGASRDAQVATGLTYP